MDSMNELIIKIVDKATERVAKELVIKGLTEHFGSYDATFNPDLESILKYYTEAGELFFVALDNEKVVGAGALIKENHEVGRIVRMSVDKECRGQGIAKKIISSIEQAAKDKNYKQIVLETNNDWYDAIGLYKSCGYIQVCDDGTDVHFTKNL
ncbi:GNAT family N-acetyltransferase [Inconstantimicrobium mannanitabidum]|uniref:Uncharacterized protein n=1 Tax=Inconstantimicrobium mannanitabidum TaxID=1604901 RepID=A0ACB5R662_9CLOT|nr:GNAT family N-acetyltransferase [Clostridium sp. TW13]GKX64752.1 hypothetical protein rsdtw13_00100 [Clostridium sp. TW13]